MDGRKAAVGRRRHLDFAFTRAAAASLFPRDEIVGFDTSDAAADIGVIARRASII